MKTRNKFHFWKCILHTNQGNEWVANEFPSGKYINNAAISDILNFWAIGDYSCLSFSTTDGGTGLKNKNNFNDRMFGIKIFNNNSAILCLGNGYIVKYDNQIR